MEQAIDIIPNALSDKECDIEIQIAQNSIAATSFVCPPEKCSGIGLNRQK